MFRPLRERLARLNSGGGASEADLKRKLLRDSFNYFISKAIPGLTGLLSVLIFVRLVGTEEYGRYSVLFALVMALAAGVSGWLPQGILRFFSMSQTRRESKHFKSAILAGFFLSAGVGIAVLAVTLWIKRQSFWESTLAVVLLAASVFYSVFLTELQAMLKSRTVVFWEATRSITSLVVPLCIILITGRRSSVLLLVGVFVGFALPLLGVQWRDPAEKKGQEAGIARDSWRNAMQALRKMWTYGWPVGIWSMCFMSQSALDRFFIQHYSGYSDSGTYAAIYDVIVRSFSVLCFPLVLSSNSLVMAHWNNSDRRGAISLIWKSLKYQSIIVLLFFVVLAVSSNQVSHLVLGRKYIASSALVFPLAVGGFLWQISYLVHKPLELMCLTKRMLGAMIVALTVSAIGNWLFIPRFGYVAAAYVSIAAPVSYLLVTAALIPLAAFRREISFSGAALPLEELNPANELVAIPKD